jgi:hypothetical protein
LAGSASRRHRARDVKPMFSPPPGRWRRGAFRPPASSNRNWVFWKPGGGPTIHCDAVCKLKNLCAEVFSRCPSRCPGLLPVSKNTQLYRSFLAFSAYHPSGIRSPGCGPPRSRPGGSPLGHLGHTRTGRNQRRARRAFIGYGPILTSTELFAAIYSRWPGGAPPSWR